MCVVIVHGDKGGVGKSTVARALIQWFLSRDLPVTAVDADRRNPDVYRMYRDTIQVDLVNLRTESGWAELVEKIAQSKGKANVVVNLPAGIGDEDERRASVFMEAATQIDVPIVLMWVINRGTDSINQLRHQLEHGLAATKVAERMVCFRNQYFAPAGEPFSVWDGSTTRKMFESRGGVTLDFPALSDRVVNDLDERNLGYGAALTANVLSMWDSITLKKWIQASGETFERAELPAVFGKP